MLCNLTGAEENVVMMDTISKRYSACGARIGALVTKNKNVVETVLKFAQARLSPPSFGQIVGEAAVGLPADYFEETKAEYKLRRDLIVKRLNNIPGVFCPQPGGAFYAWLHCQLMMPIYFANGSWSLLIIMELRLCLRRQQDFMVHRAWEKRSKACLCIKYRCY